MELLPGIFRESDVKVLVAAHLVQFLEFADVQLIFQFFHLLALLLVLERGYGVGLGRLATLSKGRPCLRPHRREEPILKPFGHRGRFLQMSVIRRDCVENGRYRPDFFFRPGYSLRLMLTLAPLLGPSLPFQLRDNLLDSLVLLQWVRPVLPQDDLRRLLCKSLLKLLQRPEFFDLCIDYGAELFSLGILENHRRKLPLALEVVVVLLVHHD